MATTILVDTSKIQAAMNTVDLQHGSFSDAWGKVLKIVDDLRESWAGVDNKAFADKVEGFRNDFKDLDDKIQTYQDFLTKAKNDYDEAQDQIKRDAAKLKSDRK